VEGAELSELCIRELLDKLDCCFDSHFERE
jgi:hypothetical protein